MNPTIMRLQEAIVTALVGTVSERWERIVVNYEMLEKDGGVAHDRLAFYITRDAAGDFRDSDLDLKPQVRDLFTQMNDEFQRSVGQRWGSCDLVVDPPAKYRFDFSYDPPKRLNGVFDEQSYDRFGPRYLENYKAERAQAH